MGKNAFAKPSEAPASGDSWRFEHTDNIGTLFIITPLREEEHAGKYPGKHIVADIIEVNEKKPEKSVEHKDVWINGGFTKGSVRGYIGEEKVLGRLQKDYGNKLLDSQGEPWYLEDAGDDDFDAANAALQAVLSPFGKDKKKDKAEPEPEPEKAKDKKKGKKK